MFIRVRLGKTQTGKRGNKAAPLLDNEDCLPSYMFITEGKQSDVKHAQHMNLPRKSVVVADRGHQDFKMLYQSKQQEITFVIGLKKAIKYKTAREQALLENKNQHILKDEIILLTEEDAKRAYPKRLRRVVAKIKSKKKI